MGEIDYQKLIEYYSKHIEQSRNAIVSKDRDNYFSDSGQIISPNGRKRSGSWHRDINQYGDIKEKISKKKEKFYIDL